MDSACDVCPSHVDYAVKEPRIMGCFPQSSTTLLVLVIMQFLICFVNAIVFGIFSLAEFDISDAKIAMYYSAISGIAGLTVVFLYVEKHKMTKKEFFYINIFVMFSAFNCVAAILGYLMTYLANDEIDSFMIVLSLSNLFCVVVVGAIVFLGYRHLVVFG